MSRKPGTITNCPHVDRKHFAKGMCVSCYQLHYYHTLSPEAKQKHHEYGKQWSKRNPSERNFIAVKSKIRQLYNMSEWNLEVLYLTQGGRCFGCGQQQESEDDRLNIDHDHACCSGETSCGDCVRGLLCGNCNKVLGYVRDCADTLQSLADYVSG